jgi:pyrroline-5-carboxylate reductase
MKSIAFIGAGKMGEALIRGIISGGLYPPENIIAADPDEERRKRIKWELEIAATEDNRAAIAGRDIICLAIKPQNLDLVLAEISDKVTEDQLLISILAGVSTRRIEESLGKKVRVIRVMPNTPALVGAGMTGISPGRYAGPGDLKVVADIKRTVGEVLEVEEDLMDAVTSVSGSGPAYIFYFVELLARAGVKVGLSLEQSELLARKTVIGAAKLLEETGLSPEELRHNVTSPGGTTEAALKTFDRLELGKIMELAVRAARDRARELGGE